MPCKQWRFYIGAGGAKPPKSRKRKDLAPPNSKGRTKFFCSSCKTDVETCLKEGFSPPKFCSSCNTDKQNKTYKRSMTKKKKVIRNFLEIDDEIFWGNAEIRNFVGIET